MLLEKYKSTSDLKKYNKNELKQFCDELRKKIIDVVSTTKGHLGSNLSIVELVVSLLKRFDYKKSKYLFDTGYQTFAYKFLTDRRDFFDKYNSVSEYGMFQEINEGDPYSGGHTSISAAWAGGYNLINDKSTVIEIIGDGSLATSIGLGGLLNFSPKESKKKSLFILNNNHQGIGINKFDYVNWKQIAQGFELEYYYVEDGHDLEQLEKAWDFFDKADKTVFIEVNTIKAKGYDEKPKMVGDSFHFIFKNAQKNNDDFISGHGEILKFLDKQLKTKKTFVFCSGLSYSNNFESLRAKYPDFVVDTGISEEIAFGQACAVANVGYNAYVFMRPSFIQRCYDQIIHDVIRNNLNITILLLADENITFIGDSHHQLYDINMLTNFDNINLYLPNTVNQLHRALNQNLKEKNPTAIRYGLKLIDDGVKCDDIRKWIKVIDNNNENVVISYSLAIQELHDYIIKNNIKVDLISATSLTPIDEKMIESVKNKKLWFYEPIHGYNRLSSKVQDKFKDIKYNSNSFLNSIIGRGDTNKMLKNAKMDFETFFKQIK